MLVESSRRTKGCGQLLQAGGGGLLVQLAEAFPLAEPVKASRDDGRGLLVGGTGELGIEPQRGGPPSA